MFEKNELDCGMAETLAYGSLMEEGYDVRISADVERGTFHRHAILRDEISEERINLLNTNSNNKGQMRIYNSCFQNMEFWDLTMDMRWHFLIA